MNFSNWKTMLFSAQGRIRRRDYWLWSICFGIAFAIIINILMAVLGVGRSIAENGTFPATFWIVYFVMLIPAMWIGVCLQIKRWHDRDKSGWWVLIGLIPIVGPIRAFVEAGCLDGTQGPNKYGASPKGIGAAPYVF
jgi:uncharacterized membrane protein YhaH (DUF805 family)